MVVRNKKTGQVGTLPDNQFNPSEYEALGAETAKAPPTPQAPAQPQGMSVDQATAQPEKKEGLVKGIVRAVVQPAMNYGKLVGAGAYEGGRALAAATGGKNVYVDENNNVVENPFMNQDELKKMSPSAQGGYAKPLLEGAKKTAGGMAYVVPGGAAAGAGAGAKILAGATQGAKIGALGGFSQSDAEDVEGLTVDTATGGLVGGATGGALSALGSALTKLKGGGDNIRKSVINPKVNADPFMAEEEQKIVSVLQNHGLTGSAENVKQKVPQVFRTISANIQKQLKQSKTKVATADVTRFIDDSLESNVNTSGMEVGSIMAKTRDKYLNQILAKTNKAGDPLNVTPLDIFEAKQNLGKQLSNVFKKVDKGQPLTEKEEVALTVWGSLDDILTAAEPTVKEMTTAQSYLYKAMPGIADSAKKSYSFQAIGTNIPVPTGVVQGGKDIVGRIMQGAGGVGEKIPGAITGTAGRTASMLAAESQVGGEVPATDIPTTPELPTGTPDQGVDMSAVVSVSEDGQWETRADGNSYSRDGQWMWSTEANDWVPNETGDSGSEGAKKELEQIMLTTNNKKEFDLAKAKYDQLVKMGGGEKKETLTAGQQKELSDIDTSIQLMDMLPGVITEYEGKMGPVSGRINAMNEFDVDAQTFNASMKAVAQMVGKAMEGGVLRKEDEEKYRKMLPTIQDTPAVGQNKIQNVMEMLMLQKKTKENTYGGATADFTAGIDINAATED